MAPSALPRTFAGAQCRQKSRAAGRPAPQPLSPALPPVEYAVQPPAYPANAVWHYRSARQAAHRDTPSTTGYPANRFQCRRQAGINMRRGRLLGQRLAGIVHGAQPASKIKAVSSLSRQGKNYDSWRCSDKKVRREYVLRRSIFSYAWQYIIRQQKTYFEIYMISK